MTMSLEWIEEPMELQSTIDYKFLDKLRQKISDRVELAGVATADHMKANKTWQNISGDAQRGLRSEVVNTKDETVLFLIHSVDYGVYLEVKHAGRYAIIVPSMPFAINQVRRGLTGVI